VLAKPFSLDELADAVRAASALTSMSRSAVER
jgi:hypothetical protein